jgi:hypothetical protein
LGKEFASIMKFDILSGNEDASLEQKRRRDEDE